MNKLIFVDNHGQIMKDEFNKKLQKLGITTIFDKIYFVASLIFTFAFLLLIIYACYPQY